MLGRDDETVYGVTAAEEQEPDEQEVLTDTEPEDAPQEPENNSDDGDVKVIYTGKRGSYSDSHTGRRFYRNTPTAVSAEDADRLTRQPWLVRADS